MNSKGRPDKRDQTTVNPYQWVEPVAPTAETPYDTLATQRDSPRHDLYLPERLTGRLICSLTTQTPLFIGDEQRDDGGIATPYHSPLNGQPAIPGSSLKGLVSSYIEALSGSALRVLTDAPLGVREDVLAARKHIGLYRFDSDTATSRIQRMARIDADLQKNASEDGYFDAEKAGLVPRDLIGKINAVAGVGAWVKYPRQGDLGTIFSVFDPDKSHSAKAFPPKHRHALWIPKPKDGEHHRDNLAVDDDVLMTFWQLLEQRIGSRRKEEAMRHPDAPPFFPKGYETGYPSWTPDADLLRFKGWLNGKIVLHRVENTRASGLSFSAVWREFFSAPSVHQAFDPNKLPWGATDRAALGPAEALLGVIKDAPVDKSTDAPGASLLAGRVRVSDALSNAPIKLLAGMLLRALNAPKPPSPRMYFRQGAGIGHARARAKGRKFYPPQNGAGQWKKESTDDQVKRELCARVQPVPSGSTFWFHLDLHNLSAAEMGLVLRALQPAAGHLHTLGMGKPLGLGAVSVTPVAWCARDVSEPPTAARLLADSPYSTVSWSTAEHPDVPAGYQSTVSRVPKGKPLSALFDDTLVDAKALEQLCAIGNPALSQDKLVWYPLVKKPLDKGEDETEGFKWFVAAGESNNQDKTTELGYPSRHGLAELGILEPKTRKTRRQ